MDIKKLQSNFKRHGLQERDSQNQMITAVFDALEANKILCVEAPTGTGKTLSYGIAAYFAKKDKQHVIISTATIALQEQLINKDLPLLNRLLETEVKYALAKGRRRYVCHARLYDQSVQEDLLDDSQHHIQGLQDKLENNKWYGDRDQLESFIPNNVWQQISTDANGCSGKRCSFYEDCAFYKARRKMYQADFIIANHSLLLSDLELGGGAILPEMDKSIYIIDECHHLPHKALSHFAKSSTIMGSVDWINQLTKLLTKGEQQGDISDETPELIKPISHQLVQALRSMEDYLEANQSNFSDSTLMVDTQQNNNDIQTLAESVKLPAKQLYQQCELIRTTLEDKVAHNERIKKENDDALNKLFSSFNFITSRAQNLAETWTLFCHKRGPNEPPIATWFSNNKSYFCHAAPINISRELTDYFWNKIKNGAILCSATLRALGKFSDYHRKTGLKEDKRLEELAIDPFFDYTQSVLYVPTMQAAPQGAQQENHHKEVMSLLPDLIKPTAGTLMLFTSRRAMERTYDDIPDDIAKDVLIQDQYSKQRLIQLHKDKIRTGERSILFGLASFGEGLDLPADFCEHVIIHKLPFSVPTTPIEVTRNNWLKKHNKNAFMLSTLPEASIKLTQYIGRLIRQETDKGMVTILDNRLYTRPYGKQLLAALPPFKRVINDIITQNKTRQSTENEAS